VTYVLAYFLPSAVIPRDAAASAFRICAALFAAAVIAVALRRKKQLLRRRRPLKYAVASWLLPPIVVLPALARWPGFAAWCDPTVADRVSMAGLLAGLGFALVAAQMEEASARELEGKVILVVGAHPDDIELGCAGFIFKAKASKARVYGLTLSRGERGGMQERRVAEAEHAAEYMGLDGYWILDFPDTRFQERIGALREAIEQKITELGAEMVLTHTEMDIHGDHRATFTATREAARDIPALLTYETVSTPQEFVPNYFVDVSAYMEDRSKVVRFHRTQRHREYMDPDVLKGRAAHRGLQAGTGYAEAFRTYRMVC
jgi:LmbE family N-acetylglucosaminyl deacetylase